MSWKLRTGHCIPLMNKLNENSIDSIVTDPPYGLSFMGKEWDHGVPGSPFWEAAFRVAKPGAHLLAFGGTRTFHRLTCAIEDAGWEIRDCIMWVYGSGFPKSLDVSKAIDAKITTGGCGPKNMRMRDMGNNYRPHNLAGTKDYGKGRMSRGADTDRDYKESPEVTDVIAKQWQGWGTAIKPAWEPIIVARKPFKGTVAANVLANGTGAVNIDGCRVAPTGDISGWSKSGSRESENLAMSGKNYKREAKPDNPTGRWPANLIHDGSNEVLECFPDGSARFFYCAKASKRDRGPGNSHPTVKPTELMRYLCRLVTPPNGLILDPFCGSGTTGKAAIKEGFNFIGMDENEKYISIAKQRLTRKRKVKEV